MRKGSVRSHLIGVFAIMGALVAAAALGGLWAAAGARARVKQAAQLADWRQQGASFQSAAPELQLAVAEYLRTGDDFNVQSYAKTLAALKSGLAQAAQSDTRDLQVDRLKEASGLLDKWDQGYAQPLMAAEMRLLDLKAGSLPDVSQSAKPIADFKELISEYVSDTSDDLKAKRAETASAFSRLNGLIVGGAALALAGVVVLLVNLLSTVAKPLLGVTAWVKALHQGKPFTLEISSNDEIGDLADSFSSLGDSLKAARRELQELAAMPDANPNPVLQLKGTSEVVYANPAAQALCKSLNLTPPELLPGDMKGLLEPVLGKDALVHKERDFNGVKYLFFFHTRPADEPTFVAALALPARVPAKK